jgi:hypothetical protein
MEDDVSVTLIVRLNNVVSVLIILPVSTSTYFSDDLETTFIITMRKLFLLYKTFTQAMN